MKLFRALAIPTPNNTHAIHPMIYFHLAWPPYEIIMNWLMIETVTQPIVYTLVLHT